MVVRDASGAADFSRGKGVKDMKKAYARPTLLAYGRLSALTMGAGGALPDIDQNGNVVGNCPTQVDDGFTRTSCAVVTATGS